ncbi:gram-negative bacterial tonB protein [mine drainage metagenome]|uniref:Gram-negative bacterial tonB protein n=1 Tax=mine drainage metagenome TaxID=410659 RepID=A0A1J5S9F6_9ZZZZ
MVIPKIQFDAIKKPAILQVEFVKKTEPAPVAPPAPEPVKPKAEPKLKPKPIEKPLPSKTIIKDEPILHSPPPPSEVIAVAPKVDAVPSPMPPTPIAPPTPPAPTILPEPIKPAITTDKVDMEAARGKYSNTLWGAIGKYKQYPRIAQMRGWQGEAIVELLLDGNGKLKSKKIIQSSGHEVLDKQALEMVEKAVPYPAPPEALRGNSFTITVPIPFKLE